MRLDRLGLAALALVLGLAAYGEYRDATAQATLTMPGDNARERINVAKPIGILPLANGGTASNLSATGGTSNVLQQSSAGASVTVGQLACAALSNAAASCSTDATNASNIGSGTLGAGRLPNPGASSLGGIESLASVSHEWINTISTSGVPSATQPACGDLSNAGSSCTVNTGTSGATIPLLNGTNTWSGVQTINNADLSLAGSSSGNTLLEPTAAAGSGTVATFPANTGTVAELNLAQSWSAVQTFNNAELSLAGSSSGNTLIEATAAAGSGTVATLPAATDTVVELTQTQTLTNKSIAASEVNSGVLAVAQLPAVDPPQGRLTLVTATPVMTANETAKATIYYDCYTGKYVPVYNGTNDLYLAIGSCEISTALESSGTGVENTTSVFDVWAVNVSGTLTLCVATNGSGGGWASDTGGSNTARGSGYSQLDKTTRGYVTNANSIADCYNATTNEGSITANKATYLGSFYTTAAGQTGMNYNPAAASHGSNSVLGLYNFYNKVLVATQSLDSTSSWTYTSSTYRAANGQSTNAVNYVDGVGDVAINAYYTADENNSTSVAGSWGVNRDSTTATPTSLCETFDATFSVSCTASGVFTPSIGFHTLNAVESGATTDTFFGGGEMIIMMSAMM